MARKKGKKRKERAAEAPAEEEDLPLGRRAWNQIAPVFWAVLIALVIRAMLLESFYVPSGSMLPTLLIGDHVFVNKFVYGSRVPILGTRLPALRDPERGEVVIFDLGRVVRGGQQVVCPLDQCGAPTRGEGFVKRIIGLPGDTVEVNDRGVIVNGRRLELRDLGETFRDDAGNDLRMGCEAVGERDHAVLDDSRRRAIPQMRITVPQDRYFVMGDNRDHSNDSRGWGTFHRDHLKGPVMFIYWSWNNRGSWLSMLNPLTWIRLLWSETRWDRTGASLDQLCDRGDRGRS